MGEQLNTGQLAAKATRRVSVGRMNHNDAPYTRISYNCSFCALPFKWKHTLNDHNLYQRFTRARYSPAHSADVRLSVEVD